MLFRSHTPSFYTENKQLIPGSIATIESVMINNRKQSLLIRGRAVTNPILLWCHGGPGMAQIGFIRHFQKELEKSFIVVNWDQRGAGKSFSWRDIQTPFTIEQFVSDTLEVIRYLLSRFNRKNLFLAGHSWGSIIGLNVAHAYPEYIKAYIGIGQIVHMKQNEELLFQHLIHSAQKHGHTRALTSLAKLGNPPFLDMKRLMIQRRWLGTFGGAIQNGSSFSFIRKGFFSSEYTWLDWLKFLAGHVKSGTLWEEMLTIDFFSTIVELSVPVYFCSGRFDYQTPYTLVQQYCDRIRAPIKKMIWFPNSAHSPNLEEPERFAHALHSIKQELSISY
ncbi:MULTISPECIES: alpha/beta fold hydrolase [Bacillus cereus group]|uniref:Alpha/beta hydrolase fold n=1 Tax=Bacillus cytotoxicus TaxID=580165 RepID=A0AAX2CJT9_9BACI|nr:MULTISPECIES: alpha/beta hydrolase [Bacillus cereus group]AWC29687.1 alpha/beta hydrolase [Bacillus cytotoxicus]AWC33692.1 alpha/beta hydrolase [Bacillus cytotoxicus]AWC37670.1 alpha/beta hydrolase [Bacillus cytotoxicus]AWC41818.1 alpha/beta hydrolase [Bacillus cytotoxicus]AWC49749.1 alpha/beta hydrolase [Bacillus cytotoxicus]